MEVKSSPLSQDSASRSGRMTFSEGTGDSEELRPEGCKAERELGDKLLLYADGLSEHASRIGRSRRPLCSESRGGPHQDLGADPVPLVPGAFFVPAPHELARRGEQHPGPA